MAKQTINTGTVANDGTGDGLRTAFGKTNSNFTELYNVTSSLANTFVNTNTGNTFGMVQLSGGSKIIPDPLLPGANVTIYANSAYSSTDNSYITITATNASNSFIEIAYSDGDATPGSIYENFRGIDSYVRVNGNNYPFNIWSGGSNPATNSWSFDISSTTNGLPGQETYTSGDPVNIYLQFTPLNGAEGNEPVVWFDPAALGITNFKGAQISYRAYINGANGFSEIGNIHYVSPYSDDTDVNGYNTVLPFGIVRTKNGAVLGSDNAYSGNGLQYTQFNFTSNADNKLYFTNASLPGLPFGQVPQGNLYIQWAATVWTGTDN